jgi:glycosyltransferase involved in cell wall biosynthesis
MCGIPKARIVYTKHCVFDRKNNISSYIRRILNKISDHIFAGEIIAVAEAAKRELLSINRTSSNITVIINGSIPQKTICSKEKEALKKHLGILKSEFVVGIVARLEEYKDHKTLLRAASLLLKKDKNFKFLLIGDGSKREVLEKYAIELGISSQVIFTGYIEDVYRYLNILDLNINCSIGTETSSLSISEGLSLGIPAIVSDFGGNPSMVINGITGRVYPQKNAYELYKIIYSLKSAPNILKKMRKNAAVDFQKRFSAQNMATQYEEFYIKMLNKY